MNTVAVVVAAWSLAYVVTVTTGHFIRCVITFVILINFNVSFDQLLRLAFLHQETMQKQRNALNSKANPFSPQELERWYQ